MENAVNRWFKLARTLYPSIFPRSMMHDISGQPLVVKQMHLWMSVDLTAPLREIKVIVTQPEAIVLIECALLLPCKSSYPCVVMTIAMNQRVHRSRLNEVYR